MQRSLVLSKTGKPISLDLLSGGFGLLLTIVLAGLFMLGEPSLVFWSFVCVGLFLWGLWAFTQPLYAFVALLFVWITVYSRSTIPVFQVEGPGNRGGVALGDLLWLGLVGVMFIKSLLKGIRFPLIPIVSIYSLLIAPYLLLAIALPLLGVAFGGWPFSYGLPGIRHLQWASFAVLAYWLARRSGSTSLIHSLLAGVLMATLFHTAYSGLQVFATMEFVPPSYLALDQLFSKHFAKTWFFYPRATGLLVNPNSYGLFGALVFVISIALILSRLKVCMGYKFLIITGALWAVLLSGSRSAVLGISTALFMLILFLVATLGSEPGKRLFVRAFRIGVAIMFAIISMLILAYPALPEALRDRFMLIVGILSKGYEVDPNAVGRLDMWSEAIAQYLVSYPWGTWVPSSYALSSAIDNYYVGILTQGTPIFLIMFILFLFGTTLLGRSLLKRVSVESKWVGLTLLGFSGVVTGASFTLSPLLQPQVSSLFWSLLGVAFAMVKR